MKRILTMIALLSAVGVQAAEKADPAKAQTIAQQVCAACHGADGNSMIPANPKLASQHEGYTYKQLVEFKKGIRKNPVMNGIAAPLSESDMRNLAAYFASQPRKDAKASNMKLIELGRSIYRGGNKATGVPACMSCHGPNGAGIPIQYPGLAGQHAAYTEVQLKEFKSGARANDQNAMMRSIAQKLSEEEIKAVAEYVSGLR